MVKITSNFLYNFHQKATIWNENAQQFLPSKGQTLRKKIKTEYKTSSYSELSELCCNPVCHAVKLPMYDIIMNTLDDVKSLQYEVLNFLNQLKHHLMVLLMVLLKVLHL